MAENREREDFEALIGSAGWHRLCAVVEAEWAEREQKGLTAALNDRDSAVALDKLRQIHAAREATKWVLALPRERLGILRQVDERTALGPSRRGQL